MATMNAQVNTGSSLPVTVFIVFLILKLTHVIDWSWWWVTAPLWIGFGLGVVFFALIGLGFLIYKVASKSAQNRRRKNYLKMLESRGIDTRHLTTRS